MKNIGNAEASADVWNRLYERNATAWTSVGLSPITESLLKRHASGQSLLEIGCGIGTDALTLKALGFDYLGIDASQAAIRSAVARTTPAIRFKCDDFFTFRPKEQFGVVYEKGFFHGLAGVRRRSAFVRRLATILNPNGLWVSVCGSADHRRSDFSHGALYLRDLVGPAEIFFEVMEIVKAPYGLLESSCDFQAWHAAFRRR